MQIKDSVAVVTGGASGLGLATTKRLLDAGATVVVIDLKGAEAVAELGDRATFVEANVTDEAAVGKALDIAESLGPVRINVNCAGIGNAIKTLGKEGPFPLDGFRKESCIHQNVKEAIVAGDERGTELIFRSLHNTARVASNVVSREVVEILAGGGQFEDVRDLVAGVRGRKVFDDGDLDAGIWTVGTVMGLIDDIPTCGELISRIVSEAEEIITGRLGSMVA